MIRWSDARIYGCECDSRIRSRMFPYSYARASVHPSIHLAVNIKLEETRSHTVHTHLKCTLSDRNKKRANWPSTVRTTLWSEAFRARDYAALSLARKTRDERQETRDKRLERQESEIEPIKAMNQITKSTEDSKSSSSQTKKRRNGHSCVVGMLLLLPEGMGWDQLRRKHSSMEAEKPTVCMDSHVLWSDGDLFDVVLYWDVVECSVPSVVQCILGRCGSRRTTIFSWKL